MKIEPPISNLFLERLHDLDYLYELIMLGHIYIEGYLILQRSDYDDLIAANPCITESNLTAWFTSHEAVALAAKYTNNEFLWKETVKG